MSLPAERIEAGKCYLLEGEHHRWVRLVTHILPSGRVRFEGRDAAEVRAFVWAAGTADQVVIVTAPSHLDAAAIRALAQEIRSPLQVLVGEVVVTVTRSPSGR